MPGVDPERHRSDEYRHECREADAVRAERDSRDPDDKHGHRPMAADEQRQGAKKDGGGEMARVDTLSNCPGGQAQRRDHVHLTDLEPAGEGAWVPHKTTVASGVLACIRRRDDSRSVRGMNGR